MKHFKSWILLLLVTGLVQPILAQSDDDTFVARPQADFQVSYDIEPISKKMWPADEFTVLRESSDAYFVAYEHDGKTLALKAPKLNEQKRTMFEFRGELLYPVRLTYLEFDQAWLLFDKKTYYKVDSHDGKYVKLWFPLDGNNALLTLPAQHFEIKTMAQLKADHARQQEQARIAAQRAKEAHDRRSKKLRSLTQETRASSATTMQEQEAAKAEAIAFRAKLGLEQPSIIENPHEAFCLVRSQVGVGSGFLCVMGDQVYLITNIHVLPSKGQMKAETTSGVELDLGPPELAEDRDLARFVVINQTSGLKYTAEASMGEKITAYGNSDGSSVVTELKGSINGVGPERLEVTATVVSGNSGGPIVNKENEVVAVVTHAEIGDSDALKKGTRFEKVRRFGARIDDTIVWNLWAMDRVQYYASMLDQAYMQLGELVIISSVLNEDWLNSFDESVFYSSDSRRLAMSHNNLVKTFEHAVSTGDSTFIPADLNTEVTSYGERIDNLIEQKARSYSSMTIRPSEGFFEHSFNQIGAEFAALQGLGSTYSRSFVKSFRRRRY